MKMLVSCIAPCFLILLWMPPLFMVSGLSLDGIALLAFKDAIVRDPLGALKSWNASDATPCHWSGVSCVWVLNSDIPRVVSLNMAGKNLSGFIPREFGALDQLHRLSLHHNNLKGTLPTQLFNSSQLHSLFLAANRITGIIPKEIGRLGSLENLDLSSNLFVGSIPDALLNCTRLQRLNLAKNHLSGPIPDGIGNLTALQQLDLSANLFSGPIPNDLGRLLTLQGTLNLSYNHLSGLIPSSLGNLPYTVSLDLSHNNLSGRLPQDGTLGNQGPGPFLGNPGLCGFPLSNPCPMPPYDSPLPSLPTEGSPPKELSKSRPEASIVSRRPALGAGAIVAIAIGDVVGLSILGFIFLYLYRKTTVCKDKCCTCVNKNKHSITRQCFRGGSEESEGSSDKTPEQGDLVPLDKGFSLELDELLRASAYVLGKGGLGIVYKVVLGSGLPVAVRRLGEGGVQRFREFEAEVQAIGRARHPNVVKLRAYYWADDEKLLIYDFIPNGNLVAALHGSSQSPSRALKWSTRLKIAQGAARGLGYLHECSPRKYVHGDIKATKILLDVTMESYIADFGLGRLINIAGNAVHRAAAAAAAGTMGGGVSVGGKTHLGSGVSSSSWNGVGSSMDWQAGTSLKSSSIFYRAPEASTEPKPTQKWDVYSFGVVLLELLSGRSPASQMTSFGVDLVSWIQKALQEETPLEQIIDPLLLSESNEGEKEIAAVFQIALSCVATSPDQRPKMKTVCESLEHIPTLS